LNEAACAARARIVDTLPCRVEHALRRTIATPSNKFSGESTAQEHVRAQIDGAIAFSIVTASQSDDGFPSDRAE
jgi:hypothetical protein